ncbi:hypothetical protein [Streptomyces erythrochromogenes]
MMCPRNSSGGLTTCRVGVNAQRQVWVHGAIADNQLDSFSAVLG